MQHTIVLGKNNFELYSNIVEISTEGKGNITLDKTTYTIYDDFETIELLSISPSEAYIDAKLTLRGGNMFHASMHSNTYDEIRAIIGEREKSGNK